MGYRLSKIYTKTGDGGDTGLGDGTRVSKDHPRVEAFGTVDELNSLIGLIRAESQDEELDSWLSEVQNDLFDLGGELSIPGYTIVTPAHVTWIEERIDAVNSSLPNLKEFILPAGNRAASFCHLARSVCRRAERRVCTLQQADSTSNPNSLIYLNRLSDWLFVIARRLARANGGNEVMWSKNRRSS
jgi:cob(I)alamin adenosyltransferase